MGNYHVCLYRERLAAKAAKKAAEAAAAERAQAAGRPALPPRRETEAEENPYETDEHVGAGLFTRKVLSKLDLQELAKSHAD